MTQSASAHDLLRWAVPGHIKLLALELARKPGKRNPVELSESLGGSAVFSVDEVRSAARQLERQGIAVISGGDLHLVSLAQGHEIGKVWERPGGDIKGAADELFAAVARLGYAPAQAVEALEALRAAEEKLAAAPKPAAPAPAPAPEPEPDPSADLALQDAAAEEARAAEADARKKRRKKASKKKTGAA